MTKERYILHVDMDAFFASCEQVDNPAYTGKPVIVGSDPKEGKGRGVVAACSYEARTYGIHSAMPISIAYRKCPKGVFLRPNMDKYAEYSARIFSILHHFSPDIEPLSIDEAFIDITGSYQHFQSPKNTCLEIKRNIKEETGVIASIGMAPNMMTAKIASDIGKPDGLVIVTNENLLSFLHPLPIKRLWGVGKVTQKALSSININTIGDIAGSDPNMLEDRFGISGLHLYNLANGIDNRIVQPSDEIKSISNEFTFDKDTLDKEIINDTLMHLSEKVSRRLRKHDFQAKTITLKIRFSDFKTYTRATTLPSSTNFSTQIYATCTDLLKRFSTNPLPIRLLGVKTSNFKDIDCSDDLFSNMPKTQKSEKIHTALDKIKDKFGEDAIGFRR